MELIHIDNAFILQKYKLHIENGIEWDDDMYAQNCIQGLTTHQTPSSSKRREHVQLVLRAQQYNRKRKRDYVASSSTSGACLWEVSEWSSRKSKLEAINGDG